MNNQDDPRFVSICQPADPVQAGMIREALEQANVTFYIDNETTSTVRFGGVGIGAGRMTVMVPEGQIDQATQILAALGIEGK